MAENIIHGVQLSPFVRKVELALDIKNIEYRFNVVLPFADAPEHQRINPMRKIPLFEDEHVALSDSTVIISYLETRYPNPALYPSANTAEGAAARAQALWYEEYFDTTLADLLVRGNFFELVFKPCALQKQPNQEKVAKAREALPRHFDFLEQRLAGRAHLVGDCFSIADLTCVSMFINAKYAGYEPDAARWPKLTSYLDKQLAAPLVAAQLAAEKPRLEKLLATSVMKT